MADWDKLFDEARYKSAINWFGDQDYMSGQSSQGFLDGANWAKPMLMEAIEALEKISNADKQLTPSPNPYYIANETLASIREKLGVEE